MDLLCDEGKATGTERAQQEMEMEMEMKLAYDHHHHAPMKIHHEIQQEISKEEWVLVEKEEEEQNDIKNNEIINNNTNNNKDMPPVDDVCPICFDRFTIPCRSNCGHWFCASCILQFWMYRSSIKPCKCPLCCCHILNLKAETSSLIQPPPNDIVEVLKKVEKYNNLYIIGVRGAVNRVVALPLFMGKMFRALIEPDGLRCLYYVMRLFGLFLALVYERAEFEFIPTGGVGIQRTFDMSASLLVLILFFVGIVYRCVLRYRARRLATQLPWDS